MLNRYSDIKDRISEKPAWFDSSGVPRYGAFSPEAVPNIYADEAILYEISCQECGSRFQVAEQWDAGSAVITGEKSLTERVKAKLIHFGDPPCFDNDNCHAGATMNCYDLRVLEFWERKPFDWIRRPDLELPLIDYEDV